MTHWRVHVQGEHFDLQELQEILAAHDPTVIQDGSNFYLTSEEWNQLDDTREIHSRAKEFIQLLENAAYIHSRDTVRLSIGGLIKIDDDGRKHHVIIAEAGSVTLRGATLRATATVNESQQQVVAKEEHPIIRHVRASMQNAAVRDALKFYRQGDWVNLYKAFEMVKDEFHGEEEIFARKLIPKKALQRFKQMAQSRKALGDVARHASQKYPPPKKAMTLTEAQRTIGDLIQNWIDSLYRRTTR